MQWMIKKKKKEEEGEVGQGEPCGGHLQDQEKCIIQQDNYTLGNAELPKWD